VRNLRQMFQTHSHAQPSPSQSLAIQEVQVHLLQQGFQRLIRSETTCSNSYWLDFTRLLSSQRLLDCEQNEQVLTAHSLGVKPYKCDFCEKSFTQRCSLESHQDKIHGVKCAMPYKKRRDKIYVCEECGFSTGDVREHYKHARETHSCNLSEQSGCEHAHVKEEAQHGCC